jgi:4-hydroxy-tetrahydrodipicolinate synthase
MKAGCYTALATPFEGDTVDDDGLAKLVAFQVASGIDGILAVGTTGESPTLTWDEHIRVIDAVAKETRGRCACIAGAGSNNTAETLKACEHSAEAGVEAVLLVDPYYNGPSSLEIRREYVAPVAEAFPQMDVIPYVIPGRTGAQLLPEDLAILHETFGNVTSVKEATGNVDNMKRTRACCGEAFTILSGDDGLTFRIMTDPAVRAAGVISVASNVAPGAVSRLVALLNEGNRSEAEALEKALQPLFNLVTVNTTEKTPYGDVVCRARNPLALKTLMAILGMPSGGCRRPLGKMTRQGLDKVLSAGRTVQADHPEILAPVGEFFGVDVAARLDDPAALEGLAYPAY